jgi:dTDP-4-dehydrorhamnose reductase
VLITGASGQVGRALLDSVPPGTELQALTRTQLDICDGDAVRAVMADFRPDLVINAAAYTAVDAAESDPERAAAVNADGPRRLAESARGLNNCRVLHISTDYVFDGDATEPYRTDATPNPLGVYGRTKLAGERAVLEALGDRAAVLRTAWVYAPYGRNFLLTMLRLMRAGGPVRVVADQTGTPTAAHSVARALWRVAELPRIHGILHWTDAQATSWYGFATAIAEEATAAGLLPVCPDITPITTAQYPTPARRPMSSVLDIRASATRLGLEAVPWRDSLRATLARLAEKPAH